MIKDELLKAVPTITQSVIAETDKKWSDLFKNQINLVDTKNQQEKPSNGSYSARIEGKKLAREIIAEEDRQRNVIIRGYTLESKASLLMMMTMSVLRTGLTVMHLSQWITLLQMD